MTGTSKTLVASLAAARDGGTPLHLQIYRRFRDAIAAGELRPGERVPSVRSLASELGVARGTVEVAYQLLGSEGYFLARGPAGTVVSPHLAAPPQQPQPQPQPEHPAWRDAASDDVAAAAAPWPFQLGLPALDAFPRKTWTRLASRAARSLDTAALRYPDPAGLPSLRHAIAGYLGVSRGFACSATQVFVTAGYRGALDLICHAVLRGGDLGWHEDPGYPLASAFLARAGMRLTPVPVDDEGLNVQLGRQRAEHARFALVTPTHQSPTGCALSLRRRLALLEWARERDAWVIEDDYDSEFRYSGRPLPALRSLDRDERVLYAGTFSKVLFPGLRLAYLVAPASLVPRFAQAARHLPGPGAIQPQQTVAAFIEDGHFARHLRKMRTLYATRRAWLADALTETFGARVRVRPQAGGIHLLVDLLDQRPDIVLAGAAQADGLAVQALGAWQCAAAPGGLLLGFANIASRADATTLVLRLRDAFARA
ncbi:MocR-like pyridoxine biosynthesis transcription factor PdxR [Chitinasiproducens palmae]|uniref:Transcriptional regulator, GntR family n=1 Tax=Chitinasiproducens palmae TaxID=1770053 RepID=A0A1H2PTZ7_9BURK|nr:PLP-dependent aminotransferase family protein [Chitinasiproducens palmae]SDV50620.1 transcriptional regulator, GntR family [Chitinasiproducens palmae]